MDQKDYSEALWQYRTRWLQQNIGSILFILTLFAVLQLISVKLLRFNIFRIAGKGLRSAYGKTLAPVLDRVPHLKKTIYQTGYAFRVIRHPIDTFYNATYLGKGSIASAICIFVLYVFTSLAGIGMTNFVFNKYGLYGIDLLRTVVQNIMPILLWSMAAFLVGAITKGQGSARNIFITAMYCLIPLTAFNIPLAILSNGLTRVEGVIYYFFGVLLLVWTGILLFIQVREVHGYDLGEAVKNILWIIFTIAVAVIFFAAVVGIAIQAYTFANELIRELLGYV